MLRNRFVSVLAAWAGIVCAAAPLASPAATVPAGFQEYHVVGHEQHIWDMLNRPVIEQANVGFFLADSMRSVVSVTASADNQKIFYDQWEDGFEANILTAQTQPTTLVFGDQNPANGDACAFNPAPGCVNDTIFAGDTLSLASDENTGPGYAGNHGTSNWAGAWTEVGDNNLSGSGRIRTVADFLALSDSPNSNGQPAIRRSADLTGATSATLSFDFRTRQAVQEASDQVVVEVASAPGGPFTVLQTFTGNQVPATFSQNIDAFISATTTVQFRVLQQFGSSNEQFLVDNVQIQTNTGATFRDEFNLCSASSVMDPAGNPIRACVPVNPRVSSDVRFDGGDRIFTSGGPVPTVHVQEPNASSSGILGGAVEVIPKEAVANATSYSVPVGEDGPTLLGTAGDSFVRVDLDLVAFDNGTNVTVVSPGATGGTVTFVLDKGQHWSSRGLIDSAAAPALTINQGTKISTNKAITGTFFTSGNSFYQTRLYTLLPDLLHKTDYVSTAPGAANAANGADLFIYNPNPVNPMTVTFADTAGSGSFNVAPNSTVAYSSAAGANRAPPAGSTVRLTSNRNFWGISAYDNPNTAFDWGHAWLASEFLTDTYTVSYAPDNPAFPPGASPVFVSAIQNNTCVRVDFDNNVPAGGTFDQIRNASGNLVPFAGTATCMDGYLVDAPGSIVNTNALRIHDNNAADGTLVNDSTGARVVADKPVALAWGLDVDSAPVSGVGILDLGNWIYPINQAFLNPVLTIEKSADRTAIPTAGGVVTYSLAVQSFSFGPLTDLQVTDLLPAALPAGAYVPLSTVITRPDLSTLSGAAAEPVTTVAGASDQLDWTAALGASVANVMNKNERLTIEYKVTVPPGLVGVLTNNTTATANLGGSVFTPSDSFDLVVTDVALSKAAAPADATPEPGDVITYTVTVANNGVNAEIDAVISDAIPPNASFCDNVTNPGLCNAVGSAGPFTGAFSPGQNAVVWTAANLPAGSGPHLLTFDVRIDPTTPAGATVANTASYQSSTVNTFDSNTTTTAVVGPDLNISLIAVGNPAQVHPNEVVTYEVTVSNNGTGPANNMLLTDFITANSAYVPESMEWRLNAGAFNPLSDASDGVEASGADGRFAGGQTELRLASLPPGEQITLRFKITVTGVQGQNISNQATVSSDAVAPKDSNLIQIPIVGDSTINGHLYLDGNGNGIQDAGEADLANVNVTVTDDTGAVQVVATDASGNYSVVVPAANGGVTSVDVDQNDPDFPNGALLVTAGPSTPAGCSGAKTDPQSVTALAGATVTACDRGFQLQSLSLTKTSDAPAAGVQADATLNYSVVVNNTSGTNQGSVTVTDPSVPGTTFVPGSAQVRSPPIRVTEYFLDAGQFTGTTFDLTLSQPLQPHYYVIVQGSAGNGSSGNDRGPDANYARLIADPFGTGELATSGAADVIRLARGAADDDWVGVITVVESLPNAGADGFILRDVHEVAHPGTSVSGSENVTVTWNVAQTMLMGGYHGAGCTTAVSAASDTKVCHARIFPSGTTTINWTRDGGGATLADATSTVMAVEWGANWRVQRVRVQGNNGGNGADEPDEYNTAAIVAVARDNTWVWGTGHTNDAGVGDSAEGVLITLGNGVAQNASESSVAVGLEFNNNAVDFEVYALTHPELAVDYRFKADGDQNSLAVDVAVDPRPFNRMALVTNGQDGTGNEFPRSMLSARYVADNAVRLQRRRSGDAFPAWVQGISFATMDALSAGAAQPNLASGYELPPGSSLTVTYQVRVDSPLAAGIGQISNTATGASDGAPGGVSDSVTSAVVRPEVSVEANAAVSLLSDNGANPLLAPQQVTFSHVVKNTGDQTDSYDLDVFSARGRAIALIDPGTGVVLATDSDGDGVWDGGATPNTGVLAPGASKAFKLRVTVPAGTPVGDHDTVRLQATSDNFAGVTDQAFDEITVAPSDVAGAGDVTVTPDHSSFASAGDSIAYTHTVTNNTGAARAFALQTVSTQGYTVTIHRDTDGDGLFTPGVDAVISSTGVLANGASRDVFVVVNVPAGAASGDVDATTLIASFFDDNGTPGDFTDDTEFGGSAVDTTTVSAGGNQSLGFDLSGGGTRIVNPGDTAVYPGQLLNVGTVADRYEFTITPSSYADDGLGGPGNQPDDGLPHTTQLVLDTNGDGVIDGNDRVVAEDTDGDGVWDRIDVNGDGVFDNLGVDSGPFDQDGDGFPDITLAPGVSSPYELRRPVDAAQGAYSDPVTLTATSAASGNTDSVTATTSVQAATLAVIGDLRAYADGARVVVEWSTASEHGTVGFTLERENPRTGRWQAINRRLLPALLHSRHGGIYRLDDARLRAGDLVSYRLHELEATGATITHGPYSVVVAASPPARDDTSHGNSDRPLPGFERVARVMDALAERRQSRKLDARARATLARATRRGPVLKIAVRESGVYRLGAERLAGVLDLPLAEVRRRIARNQFAMRTQGQQVASLADGDSALLFFGEAIDSPYTRDNVYLLASGRGLRMSGVDGQTPTPQDGQASPHTAHAEGNRYDLTHLFDDPDGDYWMWDFRFETLTSDINETAFPVATPHPAGAGTATVTVRLHGGLDALHRARIVLDGATRIAQETSWRGLTPHTVTFEVAATALLDGLTPVAVEGLGSGDPARPSTFYINDVDIRYPRRHVALAGTFETAHAPDSVTTIDGFADPEVRVLDISIPARPRLFSRVHVDDTAAGVRVSVAPRGNAVTRVHAFDASAVREPLSLAADRSSQLRSGTHAVDWLLITASDMLDAAEVLAEHRRGQGLRTMVVDIEDVYDEFADGVRDADAIWSFLAYAHAQWRAAPRYVVLGGEGSFDYKDYLGHGDSIIPTLLAPTTDGLFPSDNLFADVVGNDFLPDMAIGRLPVIDAEEMAAVARKLIDYEASGGAWESRAMFGADAEDAGGDFAAASDGVLEGLPGGLLAVDRLYLDPVALPISTARTLLHASLNEGRAFLNFFGHAASGSMGNLAPGLVNARDLMSAGGTLNNGANLPVVTAFTCLVGQFGIPGEDGVGELLLVHPDKGAAAVFSPSGLSRTHQAERLGRAFYEATYGAGERVIGEAILRAQAAYQRSGGDMHLLDIYNLLGDPATVMK